jgi:hypothetical protein
MSDDNESPKESIQQPQPQPETPATEMVTHWVTDSMDPSLIQGKVINEDQD